MGVGCQRHAPADLPPGKIRYPLHKRLGGLQGRSGQMRKISHPPGLNPQTVQPVASRYTDCVILSTLNKYTAWEKCRASECWDRCLGSTHEHKQLPFLPHNFIPIIIRLKIYFFTTSFSMPSSAIIC
jgi:hypothetical protein